jgi:hypothetical protein
MSKKSVFKPQFRDIKRQLSGRCPEVLALLEINPLAMSFGIDCPVNEHHKGLASFKVDEVANRYYCTYCKPRGASLLDLVIDLEKASTFAEATAYLRKNLGLESQPYMIDDDGTFDDAQDEVQEVEKSLIQMLGMSKPAGYTKYCLKRKIPPLGANITTSGNLYVPIRDDELKLRGILEIDAQGARLIHKDEPLQGSAVAIGPFNDAPIIAVTLEWESAVALHVVTGGMPCLAYLDPSNLLDCVDMFISEKTRGIIVFSTPYDSLEMIDLARDHIEGLDREFHLRKTLASDYCEVYTNALKHLKI